MSKIKLDIDTFKALASDTRLNILKALDGKRMSLKDICSATNLNKATLHEHLLKLNNAGLVKRKEREGHKWVYYKLTWKGECLLHPENTRIVVMFTTTFLVFCIGIVQFVNFVKGKLSVSTISYRHGGEIAGSSSYFDSLPAPSAENALNDVGTSGDGLAGVSDSTYGVVATNVIYDPTLQYVAVACFIAFCVLLTVSVWWYLKNREKSM